MRNDPNTVAYFEWKLPLLDLQNDMVGFFGRGRAGEKASFFDAGEIRMGSGIIFYRQADRSWLE